MNSFKFTYWNEPEITVEVSVVKDSLRFFIARDGKPHDIWDWKIWSLTKHRRQYIREMLSGALAWAHEGDESASPRGHVPPIPWAVLISQ